MTLIISAQCNAGLCVCADRRYKKNENGHVKFEDDHEKIYSFTDYPLMILNHGVNRFGEKYWDSYCKDFEFSGNWKGKSLEKMARVFEAFISQFVTSELSEGKIDATSAGFLLCGKDLVKGYQIIELQWSQGNNKAEYSIKDFPGLTLSGDGQKYIKSFVMNKREYRDIAYWDHIKINNLRKELSKLFKIAKSGKKIAQGEEFSNSFDCKCLRS